MAWVTQTFEIDLFKVSLQEDRVVLEMEHPTGPIKFILLPDTKGLAHGTALLLRRAARRLEEIGKELPNGPR